MKRLFLILLLFAAATAFGWWQTITPFQRARVLFESSYALSIPTVSEPNRAYYLYELLESSTGIVPEKETKDWSLEMFNKAHLVLNRWDRISHEKNALVELAKVDPVLAIELFDKVDNPQPNSSGKFPEDVRAQAARVAIFPAYLKDAQDKNASEDEILKRVAKMENLARHIGQTGSYPYGAISYVAAIIAKGSEAQRREAENIMEEATSFFNKEPVKFDSRNREFLRLLENIKDEPRLKSPFAEAVKVFLARVQDTNKEGSYKVEIQNGNKEIITITDPVEELIFRAFPIIQAALSPDEVKSLRAKYPKLDLDKAVGHLDVVYAGIVPWKTTEEQSTILHNRMKQEQLIFDINRTAGKKLAEAEQRASLLTDTSLHVVGYATLVPYIQQQPGQGKRAYSIYADELTRLQRINDEPQRAEAEIALAKASYAVDRDAFATNVTVAFSHALSATEDDYRFRPQLRTDQRKGYDALADLIEFGVSRGQNQLIIRIQQLPNTELKAYLLVHAGKGLAPPADGSNAN